MGNKFEFFLGIAAVILIVAGSITIIPFLSYVYSFFQHQAEWCSLHFNFGWGESVIGCIAFMMTSAVIMMSALPLGLAVIPNLIALYFREKE